MVGTSLLKGMLAALVVLTGAAHSAFAETPSGYHVTDLVISGASGVSANKINENGLVVGNASFTAKGLTTKKGWLWTPYQDNGTSGTAYPLVPLAGSNYSHSSDINKDGLIIGDSGAVPVFWTSPNASPVNFNGLERTPAAAGWTFTAAISVSDLRPVVRTVGGTSVTASEISVTGRGRAPGTTVDLGVVWHMIPTGGNSFKIVDVITLTGGDAFPYDLNNAGQAAGSMKGALLWDGFSGTGTLLWGAYSSGRGINDFGSVVGEWDTAGGRRGFLWTPTQPNGATGQMVTLATLGGTRSYALGINSGNQIVGYSTLSRDKINHACLWWNGSTWDLNSLKVSGATERELTKANGINNKGGIVGTSSAGAFLLTPVPKSNPL